MLILYTLFFVLLSPGVIITVPPVPGKNSFFSEATSPLAIFVHAVIFYALFAGINSNFLGLAWLNNIESKLLKSNY